MNDDKDESTEAYPWEDELLNDPRFLQRVEKARADLRAGKGIPFEEVFPEE